MKRFLKKFLLGSGIIIGLVMLALVIIAAFFEDKISERLVSEINKQLNAELTVEEFELSLLSGFPNASANLRRVILSDAMDGTLLEADNLAFRFGLLSLFGSHINVKQIIIQDGALFTRINKRGKANFDIIRQAEGSKAQKASAEPATNDFGLLLEEAKLEDVELIYIDERAKQEIKVQVKEAVLSGAFSNEQFSLSSFSELKSEFVELDGIRYFAGKDLVYDANIDVDLAKGRYVFNDVDVGIESNVFKVNGEINSKGGNTDFDLKLASSEGSLESIVELLPEELLEYFSDFKSKGTFFCNASINGRMNARENPRIEAEFGLENGRISSDKLGSSIKDVTFNASYTNGKSRKSRTTVFEISNFKGYFKRELFESHLKVSNLDDPTIDFMLDGVLPLEAVYGLFDSKAITDGDGEIELKQLKVKGRYKDMISPSRIGRVKAGGEIEFDDASMTINEQELLVDKGTLTLKGNSLKVEDIKIEGGNSEIYLDGQFLNLIPVLFADSLNSRKAELKFQATLDAPQLDIDELIAMTETPVEPSLSRKSVVDSIKVANTLNRERITKFLKGSFKAKIDAFNYRLIEGQDFKGDLTFDNNELIIKGNTDAMDGSFEVDGKAYFEDKPYLEAKLITDKIDIEEFFRQSENFGQEVLQSKHIKGKLNAKLHVTAHWDEEGRFVYEKLHVLGDVSVLNGELINYKMLYDFSTYIKIKDLRRIKFVNMRNWLEVKNRKIYMPAMFIQTNALNMTISGEHSFDEKIDYNIKVNAAQVLFSKFKKYNPSLKPQEAKKKGWFNLYYRIYGDLDDYKIKSDRKGVKRRFERSDYRKRKIQDALVKQFGNAVDLADEPNLWKDEIPEFQGDDDPDDIEYLEGFGEEEEGEEEYIEWEEEGEGGD
ncbi:MAG: AsmA-like C-terminal region-containing protein [Bacteroidota bacterium]